MKIKPVRSCKRPEYPTILEIEGSDELLRAIPKRWLLSPAFARMAGIGVMARLLFSQHAAGASTAPAPSPVSAKVRPDQKHEKASDTENSVKRTSAFVAPILDEALKHDGRGAFGCVCINPPTFLSEYEALELIKAELSKAGLSCDASVELDEVESPVNTSPVYSRKDGLQLDSKIFEFDLADRDRRIYIEYLAARDHDQWAEKRNWSTVQSYDFPETAQRVADSFSKYESDKDTVFGIFFDPLFHYTIPRPNTAGLDPEQARLVVKAHREAQAKTYKNRKELAKARLKQQVDHFIKTLRKEGVIERVQ